MALRTIMTGDVQKTALRLPRLLHEQILKAAEINNQSMNTEIVARLEASFGSNESLDAMMAGLMPDQIKTLRDLIKHLKAGTAKLE